MAFGVGHDGDSGVPQSQSEDGPGQIPFAAELISELIDITECSASSSDFHLSGIMLP